MVKVIDSKLFNSHNQKVEQLSIEETCSSCRFCVAYQVKDSDPNNKDAGARLLVYSQRLYRTGNDLKIQFDNLEYEIPLPVGHSFGNGRRVETRVCIAGRSPRKVQTYIDAFQPEMWKACWQQRNPEGMRPLCGGDKNGEPCRADILKAGATDLSACTSPIYRGRMKFIDGEYQSVVRRGSFRFRQTTPGFDRVHISYCTRCGNVLGTQAKLHMDEGEDEKEPEPVYHFPGEDS
jgi:hypothetical protein